MLERFRVKEEDSVRVGPDGLRSTVTALFQKMNVPLEDAELAADVLVTSDLMGVDSHGVSNMLRNYIRGYIEGALNPRPNWRIIRESPATANIDCDGGLGIIMAPKAMDIAIDKADATGLGMVTMMNGRHLGMAGYHAMRAAKRDMIGVCMSSTGPSVVPTFGGEARLGRNPIAVAVPAKNEPPFLLDMATSSVAGNKITLAKRLNVEMEPGWVATTEGTPIMEEVPVPESFFSLPLGSTRELGSHKGYGLACVADILTGVLAGAGASMQVERGHVRHMVAAYKIDAFTPVDEFKEQMDDFLRILKYRPPAPGQERVLYAGLPEAEQLLERTARGIPLHKEVLQWFQDICSELGVRYALEG
ncbi:MAG: Ldh family oxidoreductase [Dehalococcoidia bacterium]